MHEYWKNVKLKDEIKIGKFILSVVLHDKHTYVAFMGNKLISLHSGHTAHYFVCIFSAISHDADLIVYYLLVLLMSSSGKLIGFE